MIGYSVPLPVMEMGRQMQEDLMLNTCQIFRVGVPVPWPRNGLTTIPCRIGEERTEVTPADPQDANVRSLSEWGLTLPWDMVAIESDRALTDNGFDLIVGDTNVGQTHQFALRLWAARPKSAVPWFSLVLWRDVNLDGAFLSLAAQLVQFVYDRVAPEEVPSRYAPTSMARKQSGLMWKEAPFDVQQDDRFKIGDYFGTIVDVLPGQPQRIEAKFVLDIESSR